MPEVVILKISVLINLVMACGYHGNSKLSLMLQVPGLLSIKYSYLIRITTKEYLFTVQPNKPALFNEEVNQ